RKPRRIDPPNRRWHLPGVLEDRERNTRAASRAWPPTRINARRKDPLLTGDTPRRLRADGGSVPGDDQRALPTQRQSTERRTIESKYPPDSDADHMADSPALRPRTTRCRAPRRDERAAGFASRWWAEAGTARGEPAQRMPSCEVQDGQAPQP